MWLQERVSVKLTGIVAAGILLLSVTGCAEIEGSTNPSTSSSIPSPGDNQKPWPDAFAFSTNLVNLATPRGPGSSAPEFSGFGAVIPNIRDGSVDVYWKGAPPHAYVQLVVAHPKLTIRIHPVENSFSDLTQKSREAINLSGSASIGGFVIVEASVLPNSTGLHITVESSPKFVESEVSEKLSALLGVSVVVEQGSAIEVQGG